jgi:hypothetical protein
MTVTPSDPNVPGAALPHVLGRLKWEAPLEGQRETSASSADAVHGVDQR